MYTRQNLSGVAVNDRAKYQHPISNCILAFVLSFLKVYTSYVQTGSAGTLAETDDMNRTSDKIHKIFILRVINNANKSK